MNAEAGRSVNKSAFRGASLRADAVGLAAVAGLSILLLITLGRVVQLQLWPGTSLLEHVQARQSTEVQPAPRPDLVDRRGRPLAMSRFGQRVFVDPIEFPNPPDEALGRLSAALGISVESLAEKIVPAMARNEQIHSLLATGSLQVSHGEPGKESDIPAMRRFVAVSDIIDDAFADAIMQQRIPGVHLETRGVREGINDPAVAAIVGKVGFEHEGRLGSELLFEKQLASESGRLTWVRDGSGRPLWVTAGSWTAPIRGDDVPLSIDLQVQRIAYDQLNRAVEDADAQGGRCVVLDPNTGEVLAMVDILRPVPGAVDFDWNVTPDRVFGAGKRYRVIKEDKGRTVHPSMGRNRCVEDIYEPGSTFKSFMWAAATELSLVQPGERFDTSGSYTTPFGRHIDDVKNFGILDWTGVLINSSNIGMVKGTSRMTFKQMHDAVVRFGFGRVTGIGLAGESPGLVTSLKDWTNYSQSSVAMGYEVGVTPLQMVRAFSVYARGGDDVGTLPALSLTAVEPGTLAGAPRHRVLPTAVALRVRDTLRGVARNLDRRLTKSEPPPQYELFGKSGTARIALPTPPKGKSRAKYGGYFEHQYNSSFLAGGPAEDPRLVVLVVIDDPGPQTVRENRYYGASVAGPAVRRIMEEALAYLGVPPKPPTGETRHD